MGDLPHTGEGPPHIYWAGRRLRRPVAGRWWHVPVVSMKEILDRAFTDRYGVAAFNIINDLSIEAVLAAATEERAPVILQTSVKTVRSYGRDQLMGIFRALAR